MFTGLVEEMGVIITIHLGANNQTILTISASIVLQEIKLGDSISVNGVCLTVTSFNLQGNIFTVGLSPETLRLTNLGDLRSGSIVNLERSVRADTRMGGHHVQGHVDGTGVIVSKKIEKDSLWVTISVAQDLLRYIVQKGYICVDGASLTVCEVGTDYFTFMLVQYTQKKIFIPKKNVGEKVNLEVDIMGKHIVAYLDKLDLEKFRKAQL